MKQKESSGLTALIDQKHKSAEKTRAKLDVALTNLIREGTSGTKKKKISVTEIAKVAGVDRATLYRFHQPVLTRMREFNTSSVYQENQLNRKLTVPVSVQDYRAATEEAQREVTALARINYRLDARVSELEAELASRDARISQLQKQLNSKPSMVNGKVD